MNNKLISLTVLNCLTILSCASYAANGYSSNQTPVNVPLDNRYTTSNQQQVTQPQKGYSSSQTAPAPQPQNGYSSSQTAPVPAHNKSQNGYSSSQTKNHKHVHSHMTRNQLVIYGHAPAFAGVIPHPNDTYFIPAHAPYFAGPQWINMIAGNPIPRDAVLGGGEANRVFYICHATYQGGVHPGKLLHGKCNISWGGKEISFSRYQVLISGVPLAWLGTSFGNVPGNALPGGYENGHPLFICQANYAGGTHTGKVVGQMCNFGYAGKEIAMPYYNVLVA